MPYLIDSDVLIDISRGKQAAREYLDALTEGWAISQVSALELIVGARDQRDLANIDTFLSAFVIVPLRDSTGKRAYELLAVREIPRAAHLRFPSCSDRNRGRPHTGDQES
jgi:predicted nucleic acid-binding protein